MTRARQADDLCGWLCTNIPCFKTSPTKRRRVVSSIVMCLFHWLSILLRGFERWRTCSYCYMCAAFLPFSYIRFYTVSHMRIAFFSFLFSSHFYFIPIFTRTFFIVFNFNLPRASLDATISLSVSAFNRLNPRATSGFFQLMYLLTLPPPGVNVIMPDLSTLGWCHCEKAEHESYDWTLQTLRAEPCKP